MIISVLGFQVDVSAWHLIGFLFVVAAIATAWIYHYRSLRIMKDIFSLRETTIITSNSALGQINAMSQKINNLEYQVHKIHEAVVDEDEEEEGEEEEEEEEEAAGDKDEKGEDKEGESQAEEEEEEEEEGASEEEKP